MYVVVGLVLVGANIYCKQLQTSVSTELLQQVAYQTLLRAR